ncbi:MAG TPA: hypothetical protein PKO09_02730 [Anaerolineae bacterium]|nr:hypothetical protein [Anaerolineae bacterium]
MHKTRWFKVAGGALAILLALTAVVWVVAPNEANSAEAGMVSYAMSAPVGSAGNEPAAPEPAQAGAGPLVIQPEKFDVSPPLRDIAPIVTPPADEELVRFHEGPLPGHDRGATGADATLQDWQGESAMPSPIMNWEGVNNRNGVHPPDTNGDVGPNHYVQWVNLSFQVWDKNGTSLYGPANGNTLWTGFGGSCETSNSGDPVVLYDHLADRWVMLQFGLTTTPDYLCIAVSQTADPTGAWHRYAYAWPNNYMPDYPKVTLWPDGYYVAVNQFSSSGSWRGQGAAAFERDKMLLGQSAQTIYYDLYTHNANYGGMQPADWEGTSQPPTGAPCPFMEWDDSTWIGPTDALRIWNFHADWVTPGNSSFGAGLEPNYVIGTADVNPTICGQNFCIDQPGTTQNLDEIADRLMHRLQYRNFGSYQSMVTNHTVSIGNNLAGIHWYELRNSGGGWSIYQQGTYGPNDGSSRWMGSIAQDQAGNMSLGFSVSSGSLYPTIRYVGRLAADPLGTLPQSETTLITGAGYQSSSYGRWGDYSAMQVDPTDSCTFWYTQEYIVTNGYANWQTRIGSFVFPDCGLTKAFIGNIAMKYKVTVPNTYMVQAKVPVWDEAGNRVVGANVTAQWTLPDGRTITQTRVTGLNGAAAFARASKLTGLFTITILDVQAAGYEYDPAMNQETSEELTVP